MRVLMSLLLISLVAAVGCNRSLGRKAPSADRLMHPGPGVDGPGPGVMLMEPGMVSEMGGGGPGMMAGMMGGPRASSQVAFVGPAGMMIQWDVGTPGAFDSEPLICPGRYNFPQADLYRVKLTSIPGRPGIELYPTLEVAPAVPRTQAFLAHNAIPVTLTEEDLDQVLSGNFVSKVVYLPDAEYQELALAGVEELVSTRLDPGVDPIVEADKRGAILAILRVGNKDLQTPGGVEDMGVVPAYFSGGMAGGGGATGLGPLGAGIGTVPSNYISGVSGPEWGMPMSGTPIGLPGPPHVPHGAPAGLQRHRISNHTKVHLPAPTQSIGIHVKETPGYAVQRPPHKTVIHQRTLPSLNLGGRLLGRRDCQTGGTCPPGACPSGGECSQTQSTQW